MEQVEMQYMKHLYNKQKRGEEITEAEQALFQEKRDELFQKVKDVIQSIVDVVKNVWQSIKASFKKAYWQYRKAKRTNYRYYRHMKRFAPSADYQAVVRRRRVKSVRTC